MTSIADIEPEEQEVQFPNEDMIVLTNLNELTNFISKLI